MNAVCLNKYRNDYGRQMRGLYEYRHVRNDDIRRMNMQSYTCRTDHKCGIVNTFIRDNLIIETYEHPDSVRI